MQNRSTVECANCGAVHVRVYTWVNALNTMFHFCSMICKKQFMEQKYAELMNKEKENEKAKESVLPKVRTFIARKKGKRVTVVRSYK